MPSCVNCKHISCVKVEGKCRPEQKVCSLTNERIAADFFRKNDCNNWVDMIGRSKYKQKAEVTVRGKAFICQRTDKGVIRKEAIISRVTPHFFDCGKLRFKKGGDGNVIGFLFANLGNKTPQLWVEKNGGLK